MVVVSKKISKPDKKLLLKKAWAAFSKFIRNKYAVDGYVQCVTCPNRKPVAQMQAGHYKSSRFAASRFNEKNVHPQCFSCNIMRSGNYTEYALYLTRRYGSGILEELEAESKTIKKWTVEELENMIKMWS